MSVTIEWSQHLVSNNNAREDWRSRSRRMKEQREKVHDMMHLQKVREQLGEQPPNTRVVAKLFRLSTHPLDPGDNHNSSFKAVRDEIAVYFGLNDRYEDQLKFEYMPHLFCERPTVRAVFSFEPHVVVEPVRGARVVSERPLANTARDLQKRGLLTSGVVRNR